MNQIETLKRLLHTYDPVFDSTLVDNFVQESIVTSDVIEAVDALTQSLHEVMRKKGYTGSDNLESMFFFHQERESITKSIPKAAEEMREKWINQLNNIRFVH